MMHLHWRQGLLYTDWHKVFVDTFGEGTPSKITVFNWFGEFKRERRSFEDDPRPGRPASAVTSEYIAAAKAMIK